CNQQSWPQAGVGLGRSDEHRRSGEVSRRVVKCPRNGRGEVAVLHSTADAGELASRGPCRGKGAPGQPPLEGNMTRTPSRGYMSTGQQRIAELAAQSKQVAFTNLAHHMNLTLLLHAYHATRKDGAPGVDGLTGEDYGGALVATPQDRPAGAKSGRYRAPPVRRVHIPKGTGAETRPLGVPTFEDKVLQRAVVMLLEPLYEQDFLDC